MAITEGPERIGRPGSSRTGLRSAMVAALVVSAVLATACTPGKPSLPPTRGVSSHQGNGTSGGSGGGGSAGAYGDYAGSSTDSSLTISFTAAASGITKLNGDVVLVCSQGNTPTLPYRIDTTIPLDGSSFSSDTTTPLSGGNSEEVKVAGSLDGSGHATGTLIFKLLSGGSDICDSGDSPIKWTASIGGSTTPTTPPSSSTCTPQPCSTSNGVTLSITGLQHFVPDPADTSMYWLAVTFTVANNSSSDLLLGDQYFVVQPGNGQVLNPPLSGPALPDGTVCDPSADLPAGAHSDPQCVTVTMTPAQAAEPLKFIWKVANGDLAAGGTIDLSGVPNQ